LKNTLRPNVKKGITKSSTSLNPAFIGGGGTVEKILLRPNMKERNHKSSTSLNPCFHRWKLGGTVENTLRPNTKKGITRAAHHSIPAIGRNWVGLLKIL
jgi:hypothetical protein